MEVDLGEAVLETLTHHEAEERVRVAAVGDALSVLVASSKRSISASRLAVDTLDADVGWRRGWGP